MNSGAYKDATLFLSVLKTTPLIAHDPTEQELADAAQQMVNAFWEEHQSLANEVVDLHARLRAYEGVSGELARAVKLENLLEDAIDTLQWLAAGQEVVYAHDVDVVARGLRDGLSALNGRGLGV